MRTNSPCSRYAIAACLAVGLGASTALAQPGSDACSLAAPPITIGSLVTSDNLAATTDFSITPASTCGGFTGSGGGKDVFYTFTPGSTGFYTFSLCGSDFDTTVAVMTACGAAAANVVACNDDASPTCGLNGESRINAVALTGGVTYIVRVAGYGTTAPDSGNFILSVGAAATPPANDSCASAASFSIPGAGGTVSGTCVDATQDGDSTCDETGYTAVDVYYSFTPSSNGPWQFALCNTSVPWDTIVSVHASGCPVNATVGTAAGNQIASTLNGGCGDEGCSVDNGLSIINSLPLVSGTLYTIRVAPYSSDDDWWGPDVLPQAFTLTVTDVGGIAPPANDSCAAPTIINSASLPAAITGNSTAATASTAGNGVPTASCSFDTSDTKDVWFSFSPSVSATYTLDTVGSALGDTVLSVYSGSCASPVEVACNDDINILDTHSRVSTNLTAGTTYLVRIAGYGGSTGTYTLNVSAPITAPSNDVCATATVVTALPFTDNPNNTGATNDLDVSCNDTTATATNRGIWYSFTASTSCNLLVDLTQGTQDTVTAVFTGSCDALTQVHCADDELTLFPTTGGTQYYILIGRWSADSPPGAFTLVLNADCQPGPANDHCSAPATLPLSTFTAGDITPFTIGDAETNCSFSNSDVWYTMTTAAAGAYRVSSTPAADITTALAVFAACPTGPGQELACAAEPTTGSTSVLFSATAATTYLVRIGAYTGETVAFTLLAEPVVTQACCNTTSGACTLVAASDACPADTVSQGSDTTCTTGICGVIGSCCAANFACTTTLQTGCTGTWTSGGACTPVNPCLPTAPANDLCANATNLSVFPFSQNIQTAGATNDGPIAAQGDCNYGGANEGVDNSIWYRFAPASNGTLGYTIDADSGTPTYDALFVIYSGASCVGLAEVDCNENPQPITGTQAVSAGTVYYLCIGDWGVTDGGGETAVSFTFTPDAPTTDNCCRGTTCNPVTAGSCTGSVAGSASIVVASCGAGNTLTSCCYADYNHDGIQSIDDLFLYFNAYFTGSPYANMGGNTIDSPTIDDLFLYINAYFGTCL